MPQPDLLVLIGPSGVGKTSVVHALHRHGAVTVVPTWTTRPARRGEHVRSLDHRFVDDIEFGRLAACGFFRAIGAHPGQRYQYGLPDFDPATRPLNAVVLRASHVRCVAGPNTIVYQLASPPRLAEARLRRRGDRADDVAVRMAAYQAEIEFGADIAARTFCTDRPLTAVVADIVAALSEDCVAVEGAVR